MTPANVLNIYKMRYIVCVQGLAIFMGKLSIYADVWAWTSIAKFDAIGTQ